MGQKASNVRLTVRVDFGPDGALGPGKIRLLEAIRATGSISQAGRALDMSYRRACSWSTRHEPLLPRAGGDHARRRRQGRRRRAHPVRPRADREISRHRNAGDGGGKPAIARARIRVAPARRPCGKKAAEDLDPRRHRALVSAAMPAGRSRRSPPARARSARCSRPAKCRANATPPRRSAPR